MVRQLTWNPYIKLNKQNGNQQTILYAINTFSKNDLNSHYEKQLHYTKDFCDLKWRSTALEVLIPLVFQFLLNQILIIRYLKKNHE